MLVNTPLLPLTVTVLASVLPNPGADEALRARLPDATVVVLDDCDALESLGIAGSWCHVGSTLAEIAPAKRLGALTVMIDADVNSEVDDLFGGDFLAASVLSDFYDLVLGGLDELTPGALARLPDVSSGPENERVVGWLDRQDRAAGATAPRRAVAPPPPPPPSEPPAATATKFCIHCGATLPRVAKFCSECGERLAPDGG